MKRVKMPLTFKDGLKYASKVDLVDAVGIVIDWMNKDKEKVKLENGYIVKLEDLEKIEYVR